MAPERDPADGAILRLMGKQAPLDGWSDPPSDVRITVFQDPGDRGQWRRLPLRRFTRVLSAYGVFATALVVVALGVVVAATSSRGSVHASPRGARAGGSTVAAAYGYPARCLSVTISSIDPAFARADFNHASPCGRYAGYPTAIFHLVDRAWRPVLVAVSFPCPATGIPPAVQRELDVCPTTVPSHRPDERP